jgi:hypothetical protein
MSYLGLCYWVRTAICFLPVQLMQLEGHTHQLKDEAYGAALLFD